MSNDDFLDPDRTDEHPGEQAPEFPKVADEEDIAQRRSHERIQALFDEVTNTQIREANDLSGEFSPAEHRRAYHRTVTEVWRELQPTLANADKQTERYYWFEIDLGEFTIQPPAPLREPETRAERESWPDLQPGASWATSTHYDVTGFQQFAELDVLIRERFTVRLDEDSIFVPELRQRIQRNDPNGTYNVWDRSGTDFEEPFQVDKYKLLPKRIIDNARGALRELAEETGHGFGKPDAIPEQETEPAP